MTEKTKQKPFQERVEDWMEKQEKTLKSEEGRLKRYPRTFTMLFFLAVAVALFATVVIQVVFPPAPLPPVEKVTVVQAWDSLFTVQIPAVWWIVIFLFLWFTKW